MIKNISALNYRCLRYISQPLDRFHVIVGPNASGKSSFLDVVSFLGQLVNEGLESALDERSSNFQDLVWLGTGDSFELSLDLDIPPERREKLGDPGYDKVSYEVKVGGSSESGEVSIQGEKVILKKTQEPDSTAGFNQLVLFPSDQVPPETLLTLKGSKGCKTVLNKIPNGNDNFYDETGKGWDHSFKLGPRKSALGNLPEDESKFPVSTWLKGVLSEGVFKLVLNSGLMRRPSPPGKPRGFRPDGSNLPWVVEGLKRDPARYTAWIAHLQTALPDLEGIDTVERPEDKHRYLMVRYRGGLRLPSWMISDGTLRLLALTLLAYLPELEGVYLIEEPENGIHPQAVETVYQSLSSVYAAQILLATHSPVILREAESSQVLCFAKTRQGATAIVRGDHHPSLRDWKGSPDLSVLFAAGVLG